MERFRTLLIVCIAALSTVGCSSQPEPATRDQLNVVDAAPVEEILPPDTDDRVFLNSATAHAGAEQDILPAGAKSVLKTDGKLAYGQWVWNDEDVGEGPLEVRVDTRNQLLSVYRGGHEIGTSVILYGAEGHETPLGTFPIKRKVADYHSRSYDAPMPYSLFLTDDGVAIHGSDVRYGRATHGCVGLPEEFAQRLFDAAETGDRVEVYRGPTAGQPSQS